MQQVISQTIESDIAQFADLKATTARKLKRLLAVIAESAPFKPNMSSLATVVGVSKNNVAEYLIYMERAGLVGQLRDVTGGIRGIGKVDKVYIDNPSLMTVLSRGAFLGLLPIVFLFIQGGINPMIIPPLHSPQPQRLRC